MSVSPRVLIRSFLTQLHCVKTLDHVTLSGAEAPLRVSTIIVGVLRFAQNDIVLHE